MNDADGGAETQAQGALADGERVLRIFYPAAHHRVDVHVEVGMLGQKFELFVQHFQTFFRDLVRGNVVDRNLQPFETGAVEAMDAFRHQQITIRDQSGDHAALANAPDDV